MELVCRLRTFIFAPHPLPFCLLMRPVWSARGLREEGGGEGMGVLQVCLESQTVLHFPHIPLQLCPAK